MSALAKDDEVVLYDAKSSTYGLLTKSSEVSDVAFSKGKATFDLVGDPQLAIERPASTATKGAAVKSAARRAPYATSSAKSLAFTGLGLLPLLLVAMALILLGVAGRRARALRKQWQ
jgi:hypothetical protein